MRDGYLNRRLKCRKWLLIKIQLNHNLTDNIDTDIWNDKTKFSKMEYKIGRILIFGQQESLDLFESVIFRIRGNLLCFVFSIQI